MVSYSWKMAQNLQGDAVLCQDQQWWIQDFPLGGHRPIGGVPTSDAYTFW